jgi:hypothetical protein
VAGNDIEIAFERPSRALLPYGKNMPYGNLFHFYRRAPPPVNAALSRGKPEDDAAAQAIQMKEQQEL